MLAMCIAASGLIPAASVAAAGQARAASDWSLPADVKPPVNKAPAR